MPAIEGGDWSREQPIVWEHEGSRAVRIGEWKLVSEIGKGWELYNIDNDRTELDDLLSSNKPRVDDMEKVYRLNNTKGVLQGYGFYCPGCECHHNFMVKGKIIWGFNQDLEKPTFSPSLLIRASDPKQRCHLFVKEGKIQFLGDCFHEYAGKTIDMESVE